LSAPDGRPSRFARLHRAADAAAHGSHRSHNSRRAPCPAQPWCLARAATHRIRPRRHNQIAHNATTPQSYTCKLLCFRPRWNESHGVASSTARRVGAQRRTARMNVSGGGMHVSTTRIHWVRGVCMCGGPCGRTLASAKLHRRHAEWTPAATILLTEAIEPGRRTEASCRSKRVSPFLLTATTGLSVHKFRHASVPMIVRRTGTDRCSFTARETEYYGFW